MERKGSRVTTKPRDWEAGIEDPLHFQYVGVDFRRNYEHRGLMTILEEGSLGARTMAMWCIMPVDFSVGLILQ
ncbi:hypothetical protein V6N13_097065 [Hibiscus sabdariffa]